MPPALRRSQRLIAECADADAAAAAIRDREHSRAESQRLFRADVVGVVAGLISLQLGDDSESEDAGYPRIMKRGIETGDEIAAINLGGEPLILGAIGLFEYEPATLGPWFRENVGANAASDYGLRLPVPDSATSFVSTGANIEIKQRNADRFIVPPPS